MLSFTLEGTYACVIMTCIMNFVAYVLQVVNYNPGLMLTY